MLLRPLVCVVLLGSAACSTETSDDAASSSQDALLDAPVTRAHPEVGMWALVDREHACTGTLVTAQVVVTAAHCLDFRTLDTRGAGQPLGWFLIDGNGGEGPKGFVIDAAKSFGIDILYTNDVALLHLATPVPESVARPARLALDAPRAGSSALLLGYGCIDRDDQRRGRGVKRAAEMRIGDVSRRLCPWDSGGPTLVGDTVVQVNSYFHEGTGEDSFAAVWPVARAIAAQILAWNEAPPARAPSGGGLDT